MLTKIFHRVVNYVVSPLISRVMDFVDSQLHRITPEQWRRVFFSISWLLRPLFFVVDLIRTYAVRFYVQETAAWHAVRDCIHSSNKILYDHKLISGRPPAPPVGVPRFNTNSNLYVPMLALSVAFFAVDITRVWLCHLTVPELADSAEAEVDALWSISFGARPGGKA